MSEAHSDSDSTEKSVVHKQRYQNDALPLAPRSGLRPLNPNSKRKYVSRSLRLSNNSITELNGFRSVLNKFLAQPLNLGWLDLSFNKISCIDPILCELHELRVLYLHGNRIKNLSELDKLGNVPYLHTLTLHGNAIENKKGYRHYVIFALPQLKTMDFSGVTQGERDMAKIWHQYADLDKKTKESKDSDC